jgi:hypothetical protein
MHGENISFFGYCFGLLNNNFYRIIPIELKNNLQSETGDIITCIYFPLYE